jgi:hypothetical protein
MPTTRAKDKVRMQRSFLWFSDISSVTWDETQYIYFVNVTPFPVFYALYETPWKHLLRAHLFNGIFYARCKQIFMTVVCQRSFYSPRLLLTSTGQFRRGFLRGNFNPVLQPCRRRLQSLAVSSAWKRGNAMHWGWVAKCSNTHFWVCALSWFCARFGKRLKITLDINIPSGNPKISYR